MPRQDLYTRKSDPAEMRVEEIATRLLAAFIQNDKKALPTNEDAARAVVLAKLIVEKSK